ncbi:hypothetical protein M405DRAFT_62136 [Rhizopogon salebrosus TDB-379]|nr:hypothetical protein M405DRAFT_62136 [Rhizopogon salebrosus TDB-379]
MARRVARSLEGRVRVETRSCRLRWIQLPRACILIRCRSPHSARGGAHGLFQEYRFQGVHVAIQAVLTLYTQGLTTGVVVDLGDVPLLSHALICRLVPHQPLSRSTAISRPPPPSRASPTVCPRYQLSCCPISQVLTYRRRLLPVYHCLVFLLRFFCPSSPTQPLLIFLTLNIYFCNYSAYLPTYAHL